MRIKLNILYRDLSSAWRTVTMNVTTATVSNLVLAGELLPLRRSHCTSLQNSTPCWSSEGRPQALHLTGVWGTVCRSSFKFLFYHLKEILSRAGGQIDLCLPHEGQFLTRPTSLVSLSLQWIRRFPSLLPSGGKMTVSPFVTLCHAPQMYLRLSSYGLCLQKPVEKVSGRNHCQTAVSIIPLLSKTCLNP